MLCSPQSIQMGFARHLGFMCCSFVRQFHGSSRMRTDDQSRCRKVNYVYCYTRNADVQLRLLLINSLNNIDLRCTPCPIHLFSYMT